MIYYQQRFNLEVLYLLRLLEDKELFLDKKRSEIADNLGMGEPKLLAMEQYLRVLDLINDNREITNFGSKILSMKNNLDFIEPLLYYKLIREPEKGGHYVYSTLVNEVLYSFYLETYSYEISKEDLRNEYMKIPHGNIRDDRWEDLAKRAIGTLISDKSGFGKLGIIEEINERYEVHSYWVEPLVAAYIIYDLWEENMVAKSIKEIETEKYHIGRMFLMDEDTVRETLEEIQALKLITIETIAGLNQVRINPNITKEDILNMIIKEA